MLLSDVSLSVAYIGPNSRTERLRKTKIGAEVAHVTRDSDTTFKLKRSEVTRPLWLAVQVTTWTTPVSMSPPTASRCLSIMNIHGPRCAGRRKRKACMGWSWAAVCGVQGRGILRDFPHSLLLLPAPKEIALLCFAFMCLFVSRMTKIIVDGF